jgi:signal transduction histidine kinase
MQEAMTNALRHAPHGDVEATVTYDDEALRLRVVNDGVAESPPDASRAGGHGLVAMRERVGLLGGTLSTGPGSAGVWVVDAVLPLHRAPVR